MTPSPPPLAFTAIGNGIIREIVLNIAVSLPFNPTPTPSSIDPPQISARALWDTGATNCAITKSKAEEIGLPKVGKTEVHHGGGKDLKDIFLLNLYLPNRLNVTMVRATECESTAGNFDFIIGMEIITMGDFAITNVNGKSTVSFRFPPVRTIDYAKEINEMNSRMGSKIGRNGPCFCGSGNKYKHCHGK